MKNKILEYTWLILAVISAGIGTYETILGNFSQNYRFYIFFIIAISLYFYRRSRRLSGSDQSEKS